MRCKISIFKLLHKNIYHSILFPSCHTVTLFSKLYSTLKTSNQFIGEKLWGNREKTIKIKQEKGLQGLRMRMHWEMMLTHTPVFAIRKREKKNK